MARPTTSKPKIRRVLWRGLRRRCPHCGRGQLYLSRLYLGQPSEVPPFGNEAAGGEADDPGGVAA